MNTLEENEMEELHSLKYIAELENTQLSQAIQESDFEHLGDIVKKHLAIRCTAKRLLSEK